MNKIYNIIKTVLFIAAGILIFIFANNFISNEGANINLYVGITITVYGVEGTITTFLF